MQELATAAHGHQAFDVSDDGDDCSEPVTDEPPIDDSTIESTSSYPVFQERVYPP